MRSTLPLQWSIFAVRLVLDTYVCVCVFRSCRGLYNKCVCDGDLQRDRTGYTDMEQKIPVAVFVVGLAIVIIAGLLGLQGNSNVTSGLELMFISEYQAHDTYLFKNVSADFILCRRKHCSVFAVGCLDAFTRTKPIW